MPITELLKRVHEGDPQALNAVIPLVYNELKRLAASHLRREGKRSRFKRRRWFTRLFCGWPGDNIRRTKTVHTFTGLPRG